MGSFTREGSSYNTFFHCFVPFGLLFYYVWVDNLIYNMNSLEWSNVRREKGLTIFFISFVLVLLVLSEVYFLFVLICFVSITTRDTSVLFFARLHILLIFELIWRVIFFSIINSKCFPQWMPQYIFWVRLSQMW